MNQSVEILTDKAHNKISSHDELNEQQKP